MNINFTHEEILNMFHYDSINGVLINAINRGKRAKRGEIVGASYTGKDGYYQIKIKGKTQRTHRVIFFHQNGYWPENFVDHISRDIHDNRIENLREISNQCNVRNSNGWENNKSSFITGVSFNKKINKWTAYITINKKTIFLGNFKSKIEAAIARYNKEEEFNWSQCGKDSPSYIYIKNNSNGI